MENFCGLRHFVEDSELNGVDLVRPLLDGDVASAVAAVFLLEFQNLIDLIDSPLDSAERNQINTRIASCTQAVLTYPRCTRPRDFQPLPVRCSVRC